jgi:hypothetical protein
MANNPLQQYFRQPKIFIKLPSKGIYTKPGVITGDVENMPVFGMTGMDEIIIKTPDALITGESTVKVIESCCPSIKDGWEINNLDLDMILSAIRIATYGNSITFSHTCPNCSTNNEYDLELSKLVDYYNTLTYDNRVVLKDVVVKLRPITYRQLTEFSQRNFQLQQQLSQAKLIEDEEARSKEISRMFIEFSLLQTEVYSANIESVEAGNRVVDERAFIDEWLRNTEKATFDQLRDHIDRIKQEWTTPPQPVKCEECGTESSIDIELDHSSFFANA